MKKTLAFLAALALLGASAQHARAGDRQWATAGKILTGVAAAGLVARAFEPAPVYHETTVRYVPVREVVYVPAPPQTFIVQPAPIFVPRPVFVSAAPVCAASTRIIHVRLPRGVVRVAPLHRHHRHVHYVMR